MRKHWATCAAFLLLLIMVVEVGLSTRQQSPSWDEGDHIYSGYMNWKHREYSLNPEHPPLVKLVATLPLLPLDLKVAPREGRNFKSEAYLGGRELLFRNDPKYGGHYSADTLLFRVHMAVLIFALALAVLLFLAGNEMFGPLAGVVATTLFVFDPTILTHAPFVTTDMGSACGFFASMYTFYRFVRQMKWTRALVCGLAVGLALASKHSALAVVAMLVLLAVGEIAGRWRAGKQWPGRTALRICAGLALIFLVAWIVLWSIYSFRYAMHPSGVTMPSFDAQVAQLAPLSGKIVALCARFHLLPESYLYGLMDVQLVGIYMPTYIFGKVYAHGQWYYFPAILSLKWTVGTLGLLALAVYTFATGKVRRAREVFFLALPVAFYLVAAIGSPLNIGVRHVLPVFPFIFALAAGGAAWLAQRKAVWACVVGALLLWHVVDSLRMFPNYMPYANAFWGGPSKTNLYFSDSAVEWGQDLKWTRAWLDRHNVKECWYAYFVTPFLLPSDYGIPCKPLPTFDSSESMPIDLPAVIHGPVLISFPDLNGFEFGTKVRNPYQSLFLRKPDDVIANSTAVFYGDFSLPEAAALAPAHRSAVALKSDAATALREAQHAVALAPNHFDANIALGDAYAANGNRQAARAAYSAAQQRIAEMEPTAQEQWTPVLAEKLKNLD